MNRPGMIAKIQIEFPKTRPDLDPQTDANELRKARLEFCGQSLGLSYTPASLTKLSDYQLKIVLDRLSEARGAGGTAEQGNGSRTRVIPLKPRPGLVTLAETESGVSCGVPDSNQSAEIHHLAGNEIAWAIGRVFEHLNWPPQRRRDYMSKRFKRTSEKVLRPDQARSLLIQLLTIAASAELKLKLGRETKISREQIAREIPAIKRRLGIDLQKTVA